MILRKRLELEEISRKMHMATEVLKSENFSVEAIESGKPLLGTAYSLHNMMCTNSRNVMLIILVDNMNMLIITCFHSSFRCQGS